MGAPHPDRHRLHHGHHLISGSGSGRIRWKPEEMPESGRTVEIRKKCLNPEEPLKSGRNAGTRKKYWNQEEPLIESDRKIQKETETDSLSPSAGKKKI